ncbi:hypothetical protein C0J52_19919 [Blattella germanica]|nr:hypothetical protein C0J52_19919 [Blattella germanica]
MELQSLTVRSSQMRRSFTLVASLQQHSKLSNLVHRKPNDLIVYLFVKIIYYSYLHSIIKFSIIFCGNSSGSNKVFLLQKRVNRIITHSKPKKSCMDLFKQFNISPMPCEYT